MDTRLVCGRRCRSLMIALLALALLGCNLTRAGSSDPPTPIPPTPPPAPTVTPDTGWQPVASGMEWRQDRVELGGGVRFTAVVVRIDPAAAKVRVHYSPGEPRTLPEWRTLLPDAAVIVNGGFFDEAGMALGLLISDGQAHGQSFAGFGGMLQVGAGGVRVRSLVQEPYTGEPLQQAVQAFPMLVEASGVQAPQGDGFDQRSRRMVAAQDRAGRILLIAVPAAFVSFAELQTWLLASDLDVTIAFALDGGRSTGLVVRGGQDEFLPALDRLPVVIAVYPS